MFDHCISKTDPARLERLSDWCDQEAWADFVKKYDPLVQATARHFRLDRETAEELGQIIWVAMAWRMKTFRYDPTKTFRGWFRRFCHSRAIDLLRARKTRGPGLLQDERNAQVLAEAQAQVGPDFLEETPMDRPKLLRLAEEVQARVRRRVQEGTWRVFWSVAIEGLTIREAAEAAGLSYYAAFAAQKRVGRLLGEEGKRAQAENNDEC